MREIKHEMYKHGMQNIIWIRRHQVVQTDEIQQHGRMEIERYIVDVVMEIHDVRQQKQVQHIVVRHKQRR